MMIMYWRLWGCLEFRGCSLGVLEDGWNGVGAALGDRSWIGWVLEIGWGS